MKKKILLSAIFCIICTIAFTQSYTDFMNEYINNQHKVRSLVTAGSMSVLIKNAEGNILKETSSEITIYMKYPDLFKLVMDGPVTGVIVQKGNEITQKIEGMGPATTTKVDETADLFKKYFFYGVEEQIDTSNITGHDTVTEEGMTLYKFSFKMHQSALSGSPPGVMGTMHVDRGEIYFNSNNMVVRQVIFADDKEMVRIDMTYVKKEGIFIAKEIRNTMSISGILMENVISYCSISVNTKISDKEFELR
jgi:outer membrane lipoprotein-sorting protein